MSNNSLAGPIVVYSKYNIRNVRVLKVDNNGFAISGAFLATMLPLFPNLTIANFSDNKGYGSIPPWPTEEAKLECLYLAGNEFSGQLPSDLGLISTLHELDFSNNAFSGTIPSEFGSLTNLMKLDVSDTSLSGQIPVEFCERKDATFIEANCSQIECCRS